MTYVENVAAVATIVVPLVGLQTFWVARSIDALTHRFDRIDDRLDHIEQTILGDHGQRITRLEERTS